MGLLGRHIWGAGGDNCGRCSGLRGRGFKIAWVLEENPRIGSRREGQILAPQ
ncbi:hypothetical protein DPMN_010057 [Dreissena polymorpha]|uniref:Uncharacterized protein n=1 Tax=Dreissena polymorpha TaxID=45954 RepID=A0A9D4N0T5_DREPO|nr:hypothetical protein DPMN_010057 [Dreissena polymorpha]